MAFDNTVQRGVKLPRIKMECGLLSFTTTSVTIEVPTKFRTKIWCGFGVTQDGTGVSQDAVITAGCVTLPVRQAARQRRTSITFCTVTN